MNLVCWWGEYFALAPGDKVLLFSSLSFIMSLRQLFPTLCAGATCVIPPSAAAFGDAIRASRVNKLVLTPSALATLPLPDEPGSDTASVALVQVAPRVLLVFVGCLACG